MPRFRGSVGQLLVNEQLPEDLRDYQREMGGKEQAALLRQVAEKHPERYREISHALNQLGKTVAYRTGGYSFGVKHLLQTPGAKASRMALQKKLQALDDDDSLSDRGREAKVLKLVDELAGRQNNEIYQEALAGENPLAFQVLSGARGKPGNLASLLGSDLLYTDHRDRVIPVPIMRSYSQGLSPAEYWAASYGARKGVVDVKLGVADTGYFAKQLNAAAHRLLVSGLDGDDEPDTLRGLPVDTDDNDNEGALLAAPAGGYARNTILTPKILSALRKQKINRLLVRSPLTGGAPDGGVYARDVGIREFGRLPDLGSHVGITAAQALSEGISQGALSSKHSGGVAGAAPTVSGFAALNQLVQVPKTFKGGASHAIVDGTVEGVTPSPTGGYHVTVGSEKHYVPAGLVVSVKRGDRVEAGDVLSDGLPNPGEVVEHKGIGEGRRYFVKAFRQAMQAANLKSHRRNVELMARGLIDHVQLTEEHGDYAPDDVVPYRLVEQSYRPREGHEEVDSQRAVGRYLEKPYLHYSVGTRVRPSVLKELQEFGVKKVAVHDDPPPFTPVMVRAATNLQHDPDWLTKLFGSYAKDSLLSSAQTGGYSSRVGTSFVPSLARGVDFGKEGPIQPPKPFADSVALPAKEAAAPGPATSSPAAAARMAASIAAGNRAAATSARAPYPNATPPAAAPRTTAPAAARRVVDPQTDPLIQRQLAARQQQVVQEQAAAATAQKAQAADTTQSMAAAKAKGDPTVITNVRARLVQQNLPPEMQNAAARQQQMQSELDAWNKQQAIAKADGDPYAMHGVKGDRILKLESELRRIKPYAELDKKLQQGGRAAAGAEFTDGDMGIDTYLDFAEQQLMVDKPGYKPTVMSPHSSAWKGRREHERSLPIGEQIDKRRQLAQYEKGRYDATGYTPEADQIRQRAETSELTAASPLALRVAKGVGDATSTLTRAAGRGLGLVSPELGQRLVDGTRRRDQELDYLVRRTERGRGGTPTGAGFAQGVGAAAPALLSGGSAIAPELVIGGITALEQGFGGATEQLPLPHEVDSGQLAMQSPPETQIPEESALASQFYRAPAGMTNPQPSPPPAMAAVPPVPITPPPAPPMTPPPAAGSPGSPWSFQPNDFKMPSPGSMSQSLPKPPSMPKPPTMPKPATGLVGAP